MRLCRLRLPKNDQNARTPVAVILGVWTGVRRNPMVVAGGYGRRGVGVATRRTASRSDQRSSWSSDPLSGVPDTGLRSASTLTPPLLTRVSRFYALQPKRRGRKQPPLFQGGHSVRNFRHCTCPSCPPWLSFGTAHRRGFRPSHFEQSLKPTLPGLPEARLSTLPGNGLCMRRRLT